MHDAQIWFYYWIMVGCLALAALTIAGCFIYQAGYRKGYAAGRGPFNNHKRGPGGRFIKNTGE